MRSLCWISALKDWIAAHSATHSLLAGTAGASALVFLTALGGLLSRLAPGLRAPLDVALDVDNCWRGFPRIAIPRARIFVRYAALLGHVPSSATTVS